MTYTMDSLFVNAYTAMKHHLASQQGSKLRGLFREEMVKGEKAFFDRVGKFSVSRITSVGGQNIIHQDAANTRRMVSIDKFDNSTIIHDIEQVKMLADPTNDYVREIVGAHNRNFDDVIFAAMLGSASTGKDGAGSQAFDSNYQIAHGSAGLTLAKLLQAQRLLQEADVDLDAEKVYLIINPSALEDLLAISNFTSSDFQNNKILGDKQLPMFRGMNVVLSNRIPVHTAGSVYRAIVCSELALRVGKYGDPTVKIDTRVDLVDQPTQIYSTSSVGAVRMEESRIVDVLFQ